MSGAPHAQGPITDTPGAHASTT